MTRSKRNKRIDYSKISSNEWSVEDVDNLFEEHILGIEETQNDVYVTLVGNLNVRSGAGKDAVTVNAKDIYPDGADDHGRLRKGVSISVSETVVDADGNIWGKLADSTNCYVCIFDKGREMYFASKGE